MKKIVNGNWVECECELIDGILVSDDIYIGNSYPVGCMDALALNYDATATVDDGSCAYPPCGGFVNSQAYQMCWGNQAAIQFEWEGDTAYSQCDVETIYVEIGREAGRARV